MARFNLVKIWFSKNILIEWTCSQFGKNVSYCLVIVLKVIKMMFHIGTKNIVGYKIKILQLSPNWTYLWPRCGVCEWDWASLCCAQIKCVPVDISWKLQMEYYRVVLMRWWRHKRRKYVSLIKSWNCRMIVFMIVLISCGVNTEKPIAITE